MTPIPNPHNGFVPNLNDLVRVVGACHPQLLNKIVRVISVDETHASIEFSEGSCLTSGELLLTSGELGGLEFVASEEDIRNRAYSLWEKDEIKKPAQEYWREAVWQLSTNRWNVQSGELQVEIEGLIDDLIPAVFRYVNDNNIFLGETVQIFDCEGRSLTVNTEKNLFPL